MTEAEVISRVKERLDEDAATSQRYTTADLTEYIYDGARYYIACVGNQYATTTIIAVAYQQLYDLPCDFIQVERVLWKNGSYYTALEPTQARELDDTTYLWQQQTDVRSRAYYRFSTRRLGLWPVPTEDGAMYVVHYQQDVAEDLSKVAIEDHECIVDYALARCLLSEGKAADGGERYGAFSATIKAARKRRASMDRVWAMSGYGGLR